MQVSSGHATATFDALRSRQISGCSASHGAGLALRQFVTKFILVAFLVLDNADFAGRSCVEILGEEEPGLVRGEMIRGEKIKCMADGVVHID